jgi:hypothetical protein
MAVMSGFWGSSENSAVQDLPFSSGHVTVTESVEDRTEMRPGRTPERSMGTAAGRVAHKMAAASNEFITGGEVRVTA